MPAATQYQSGLLYEQAGQFANALEASQTAAVDQMLGAWTDSYWGVRQELDAFLVKVAEAKAAGVPVSPAWAFQEQRLKNVLDTTKAQIARYASDASLVTEKAQWSAIQASLKHAEKMAGTAVASSLPGIGVSLATVNPKNLEHLVGHLANGSVLRNHLALTLPAQAASKVQEALIHGVATGKSQDWMIRKATEALGITHARATTILRTESLRAYRAASRATYLANSDVLGGWTWHANLDSRCCVACVMMDGTHHPLDATLDGHPRCRCAMVPRTKSWEDLGLDGIPDSRPPVRSGAAWLESQTPAVQRAVMGRSKFDAWTQGAITLDDMVGRTYSPAWGTTRSERSLVAILEDRNQNWMDTAAPLPQPVQKVAAPNPATALEYAERYDLEFLNEWAVTPGNSPQALADLSAAINLKVARKGRQGPSLPRPDLAKVEAAVTKLENAVLTKGYPSKGYSQTKAIYKAQANGTPGTQVGVVKSLSWEQKITAQKILEKHDAALPDLARKWAKKDALDKAHGEALTIHAAKKAEAEAKAIQDAVDDYLDKFQADLTNGILAAKGPGDVDTILALKALDLDDMQKVLDNPLLANPIGQAKVVAGKKALAASKEAYQDAVDSMKAHTLTDWENPQGGLTMSVDENGWATITPTANPANSLTFGPQATIKIMADPEANGWKPVITPNPVQVKNWKVIWDTDDGFVDAKAYDLAKKDLDSPILSPQDKVDLQEALDQDWAAGKWKPEPVYVDKIKKDLDSGALDIQTLQAIVKDGKPLSKANAAEAIAQHQAEQIAKASIPVPKPAIMVDKIKWEKASDAQVQKLIAGVEQGKGSVDDLYVKFQASKNAGPKANYAKAILHLEGKADSIPGANPYGVPKAADVNQLVDYLEKGVLKPDALEGNLGAGSLGAQTKANYWQALNDWKAKNATPAPKPPAPAPQGPVWPTKPPWEPSALKSTGQTLGTHGAKVMEAPDGTRWLFKPPKAASDNFLATLDESASRFQAMAGLKAPDTYVVTIGGKRGSIQRMFPSSEGFPSGFQPAALAKKDLDAVQREHVLDWFLSNHDGHRDQFLRLEDGSMVGIDKGQAFRWFGQDRLDWDFHPNGSYGTPEPVYNALWRDFAAGKDVDLDPPGTGALWDQVKAIQAISDDDVRSMFREYAQQAAAQGKLGVRQNFPGLVKPSIQANDVEAFLDALVARKNGLADDFTALYEKAAKARAKALPGWTPKAAVPKVSGTKAKWVGKDKPDPPKPPTEPKAETAPLFDGFLDDAKARYSAFSGGKSLENSNNWARFRRVVDDLDESAVDELVARSYLDDATAAQARALIREAKAKRAELEGTYKRALADHDKALKGWKKDLGDWKDANGVKDLTAGMDDAVIRHTTDDQGVKWANRHFDENRYTAGQRQSLKSYTGSSYRSWNDHLRQTKGNPTQYQKSIQAMDKAMDAQPIPEDVILHRGTEYVALKIDGRTLGHGDDLSNLIGSVQVDHGYMSTSVGNSAAFSSLNVQMKIRAPAGTPGSYVQMFSQYGDTSGGARGERELILARGTHLYVHNAYRKNGKWFLEVEVVPDDFDPVNATPSPSTKPWSS